MRWLVVILLVALALRVSWVALIQPDPTDGRFDDTMAHYYAGRFLADGEGLVGLDEEHTPTAGGPPGYLSVLAAVFLLPGDDVAAARALNIVAGLAVVVGVYYLGWRLWDSRAGLLAAGIMALFPSHIFFSSLLMKEPLNAALVVGLLCLTLAWTMRDDVSPGRVVLLGIVAAFAAMVRPEGLLLAAVIVLAWLVVHRSWRRVAAYMGLLLLGMAVLFVPWTIRNAIQLGSPVFGSTGAGALLVEAHHPDAGGRPTANVLGLAFEPALRFQEVPLPEREVRTNNALLRQALSYAVHHIPRELSLVPHRLAWFFRGDRSVLFYIQNALPGKPRELSATWEERWGAVADVYYYGVAAMMVFGLPFWLRRVRRQHVLLWGTFAGYSAMWAFLFVGNDRYHFSLLPVFAVLGAIGLSAFVQRWQGMVVLGRDG